MADNLKKTAACTSDCACRNGINRRDLLRLTGAGAMALGFPSWRAMAGPFDASDFEKLVPADKRLSAEWIKSLYERGEPYHVRRAGTQVDRHADRRPVCGSAVSGRRWPTLALGHLQPANRHWGGPLCGTHDNPLRRSIRDLVSA